MAVDFDAQFSGGATALSGYTPNTGSAFSGISGTIGTNGSGLLTVTGAPGLADFRVSGTSDGTWKFRMTNATTLLVELAIHSTAASFGGSYITINYKAGTAGISIAKNDVDQQTSTVGFTAATACDFWVRVDSARYRVWANGNQNPSTPNIDWTDGSPITSTRSAVYFDSTSGSIDYITVDSTPTSPSLPTFSKDDNQTARRILRRMTRDRTLRTF